MESELVSLEMKLILLSHLGILENLMLYNLNFFCLFLTHAYPPPPISDSYSLLWLCFTHRNIHVVCGLLTDPINVSISYAARYQCITLRIYQLVLFYVWFYICQSGHLSI